MRFVTKFYVVALLATCTLTYFAYELINRQSYPVPAPAAEIATDQGQEGKATTFSSPPNSEGNDKPQDDKAQSPPEKSATNEFKNRLVVFGDSSSDDSIFPGPSTGKVWNNLLCSKVSHYDPTSQSFTFSIVKKKMVGLLPLTSAHVEFAVPQRVACSYKLSRLTLHRLATNNVIFNITV